MNMTHENKRVLNEIRIALNKEAGHEVKLELNETTGDYEFENKSDADYGTVCYLVALNTMIKLNNLQQDAGITGFQHSVIAGILNKFVNCRVLTPIEDNDNEWTESFKNAGNTVYQGKRYTGIFKNVSPEGVVTYNDVNRFTFRDNGGCFHCGTLNAIAESHYGPITLPYMPKESVMFDTVTFDSVNGNTGEFDTICVYDMCGESIYIDSDGTPLTKEEFLKRYENYCKVCEDPVPLDTDRLK